MSLQCLGQQLLSPRNAACDTALPHKPVDNRSRMLLTSPLPLCRLPAAAQERESLRQQNRQLEDKCREFQDALQASWAACVFVP